LVEKSQNLIWLILTIQNYLVEWNEERKRKFWKIKMNLWNPDFLILHPCFLFPLPNRMKIGVGRWGSGIEYFWISKLVKIFLLYHPFHPIPISG